MIKIENSSYVYNSESDSANPLKTPGSLHLAHSVMGHGGYPFEPLAEKAPEEDINYYGDFFNNNLTTEIYDSKNHDICN